MTEPARPSFAECLHVAAGTPALVAEFDRLTGHNLSRLGTGSALDQMIDDACGVHDEALRDFIEFVWDCVYMRFPEQPT